MACLCIKYMPRFSMPGMWYIWIMNVWRVKAFFNLQFKGPKSFGTLNYSYIQMNLTLRTFFSFLLLFHEFRVYPSEGSSKIAKTISGKGFSRAVISKRFGPLLGRLAQTCQMCPCAWVFLPVSPLFRDVFETVPISYFHLPHCYSGQVLACQAAVLCVCVSVSLLRLSMFSLLHALRSVELILIGMTLPWDEKLDCSQCIFLGWRLIFEIHAEHHICVKNFVGSLVWGLVNPFLKM